MVKKRRRLGWPARLWIVLGTLVVTGAIVWIFFIRDRDEVRIRNYLAQGQQRMAQGNYTEAIAWCKKIEEISHDIYASHWLQYEAAKALREMAEKAGDQNEQINQSRRIRDSLDQCYRLNEYDPRIVLDALKQEVDNYNLYNAMIRQSGERDAIDEHYREVLSWTRLPSMAGKATGEMRWYRAKITTYLARNIMDYMRSKGEMSLIVRAFHHVTAKRYLEEADEILEELGQADEKEPKYPLERGLVLLEKRSLARLVSDSTPVDPDATEAIYDALESGVRRSTDKVQGVLAAAKICRRYDEGLAAEFLQRQMEASGRSDLVSLELARACLSLGNYDRAGALAEEVGRKGGETLPDAFVILAAAYELSKQRAGASSSDVPARTAETFLKKAAEAAASAAGPIRAGYLGLLGDYYVRQNRLSEARDLYEQGLSADDSSVDLLLKSAQTAMRIGRLAEAKERLNELLRRVPGHLPAMRALDRINKGAPEDIEEQAARAEADVKADPVNPMKLYNAADLTYQAVMGKRGTERVEKLRKGRDYLMRIEEASYSMLGRPVWVLRFRYTYGLGLYEEAVSDGEKAIKAGLPQEVDKLQLRKQLATAYLMIDDVNNAQTLAQNIELSLRSDTELQLLIARILLRTDDGNYSDRVMARLERAAGLARRDGRFLSEILSEMADGFWQRGRMKEARQDLEQAQRDWDEARRNFEEAVRHDPTDVKTWRRYCDFMANLADRGAPSGAVETGLEVLKRALEANRNDNRTVTAIHHARYEFLLGRGRVEEAENALLTALSLAGGEDQVTLRQLLARYYEDTGRPAKALETYEQIRSLRSDSEYAKRGIYRVTERLAAGSDAVVERLSAFVGGLLKENPDDAVNIYLSGQLNERLRRYEEALSDYEQVARRQPGNEEAVQKILDLLKRMGYPPADVVDKSISFLERIRARGGMGGDPLYRLAELYYGKKDYDKAADVIQEMHQGRWRSARSSVLRAKCLHEKGGAGGLAEADEELQWAISNARNDAADRAARGEAYALRVKTQIESKDLSNALSTARTAFEAYPLRDDLFEQIARLYAMGYPEGRDKMMEWLEQQMTRSRDNYLLLNMRGRLLIEAGRLDEAEANLAHASEIRPDWIEPAINRSIVQERKNDLQRAIAITERAAAGSPKDWLGPKRLGDLYRKLGDNEKALRNYEKARELHPGFEIPPL